MSDVRIQNRLRRKKMKESKMNIENIMAQAPQPFRSQEEDGQAEEESKEAGTQGIEFNLFKKLEAMRAELFYNDQRFPQLPLSRNEGNCICPITGLLLFDPVSSPACGDIPHYYERVAIELEQERQEKVALSMKKTPLPWRCPCCHESKVVLFSAFSSDHVLREDIRGWLSQVKQYMEDLNDLQTQSLSKDPRVRTYGHTLEKIQEIREDVIRSIAHFLKYGNNKEFLQSELMSRSIQRLKQSIAHMRKGDLAMASAVSGDCSNDISDTVSDRSGCRLM